MNQLLIGGIATASLVAGMFFLRFWVTTRDRFFLFFAASFLIEGTNRLALSLYASTSEDSPVYYLIRLVSYGLIIAAIVHKNRSRR